MSERSAAASLSVCCLTRGPTGRVAALLRLLRSVADEIVVAVDDRVEPATIGVLVDVADIVTRYPYAEPVDRAVGWLHSLCSREWILSIDDDEIPSAALVEELPRLLETRDVTHFYVSRRWLYPDLEHVLDTPPWRSDYQLRLVANDPRLLRFPGLTHVPIQAVGPARYVDLPVYHTDLVVNALEARQAKARRYERARPGHRIVALPLSHAFYLPEARTDLRTVAVPDEDARLIRDVFAAPEWPRTGPAPPVRQASRDEVDRFWTARPFDEDDYRARLEVVDEVGSLASGEERALELRVENLGRHIWPGGADAYPEVRVSYRWVTPDGATVVADGLRTPLPADVPPGASALLPVAVTAPPQPGRYTLVLDLVHEHVRWFGCDARIDVDVTRPRRIAVLAGEAALRETAESVLDGLLAEPVLLGRAPRDLERRFGYPAAPSPERFLLGARSRLLRVPRVALLLAAARVERASALLPSDARAFLSALAASDALVVVPDGVPRSVRAAVTAAARALGVEVRTPKDLS